jgi:hypothetical protein
MSEIDAILFCIFIYVFPLIAKYVLRIVTYFAPPKLCPHVTEKLLKAHYRAIRNDSFIESNTALSEAIKRSRHSIAVSEFMEWYRNLTDKQWLDVCKFCKVNPLSANSAFEEVHGKIAVNLFDYSLWSTRSFKRVQEYYNGRADSRTV